MGTEAKTWWYTLLAALPNPEAEESVNIGIIFGNGYITHFEWDRDLTRLSTIASAFDRMVLTEVLYEIEDQIVNRTHLEAIKRLLGPHLILRDLRPLYYAPNREIIAQLVNSYLQTQRSTRKSSPRTEHFNARLDSTLKIALTRLPYENIEIKNRLKPKQMYRDIDKYQVSKGVPSVDRVFRTNYRDLLIGAIDINTHSVEQSHAHSSKILHAFWYFNELKEVVEVHYGKEIRTLGIILADQESSEKKENTELLSFYEDMMQRGADGVIRTDRNSSIDEIASQIEWVTQSN